MVQPKGPGLIGKPCLVPSWRLARRLWKKKLREKNWTKRTTKSALTAVHENLLLYFLHCRFLAITVAHLPSCLQVKPKRFRRFPEIKMCRLAWRLMDS